MKCKRRKEEIPRGVCKSKIRNQQSEIQTTPNAQAICNLQSAIRNLRFAICNQQMPDPNHRIQQQFGASADKYATSAIHASGASLARLVELTQPHASWHALDVSTGAGHTALKFAPHVARVTAVDLTPQMLDTARKLANERGITNIEFRPADAHALPFDDNTFDLVTNRLALHHYTDAPNAIHEMARVLKRDGILGLTDNTVPPDKQTAGYINHYETLRDPSHHWCYPVERLQRYFEQAGLTVTHVEANAVKEMEFDAWADRMNCTPETKQELKRLLDTAPPDARAFFMPRTAQDKLYFSIRESIFIARKT